MIFWGRRLLVWGAVMALAAATPALLCALVPPLGEGFFGTLAAMLSLSVTPIGLLVASVGVILLLVGVLRRGRP